MDINTIASLYNPVYLVLVTIVTMRFAATYKANSGLKTFKYPSSTLRDWLIVSALILIIGLRPISGKYFVDMAAYAGGYMRLLGEPFTYNWDVDNKIFDNLFAFWYGYKLGIVKFFVLIAAIYFGCAYVGIQRIFPTHTLPAYFVFLAAFSTFSYATNGIKAGAGASIFIMALGFWDKKIICYALALVSLGFHHSMQLPVAALVIVTFIRNPKFYYAFWVVCLLMSIGHVTYFQNLFGGMTDEQGAGYLLATEETSEAHIGFRPDFIIYSAMPVAIGFYYEIKRGFKTKIYSALIHLYITTNAIWMLCMYAAFTNRIAYLSWFLYPIVLIYPYLYVESDSRKFLWFRKTMIYHLCFTLFMSFVYYGLLKLGN